MTARRTVAILQPYVPQYRLAFFEQLKSHLNRFSVDLVVYASKASGMQAARDDAATLSYPWLRSLPSDRLPTRKAAIRRKRLSREVLSADLVVAEHASGALETTELLLRRPGTTAVWGHGRAYVTAPSVVDGAIEAWQMRRAAHCFVYTAGGQAAALAQGVELSRITVVRNSSDTTALISAAAALREPECEAFQAQHGLTKGFTVAYLGGLDASKRLDLLVRVGDGLAERLPAFRMLVAGAGDARPWLDQQAASRPWLVLLGRADDRLKALIADAAEVLVNPGRVGLIAVDSFALGLPLATVNWPLHAPEFEYLRPGYNALVTADDERAFTRAVAGLLTSPETLRRIQANCRNSAAAYSIEGMASRFHDGILQTLEQARHART